MIPRIAMITGKTPAACSVAQAPHSVTAEAGLSVCTSPPNPGAATGWISAPTGHPPSRSSNAPKKTPIESIRCIRFRDAVRGSVINWHATCKIGPC